MAAAAVFALTTTAHATIPQCPVTNLVPSGTPVATLVVNVHVNNCFVSCSPGNQFPCCPSAASVDLPPGQYVVTMSGQECSTEGGPCNSDGTPGYPGCLPTSANVCSGEAAVCGMCAEGHPTLGGPVLIDHPGGAFRAWRNDCFSGDNFGIYTFNFYPAILEVDIDIKPGSFPNSVNPGSKGVIPVAILTTASFDATTVDSTTVLFGKTGTEAAPVQSALEDVDGDGDTDMILHFKTQGTGILCGDTSASLTGETFGGQMIERSDSIKTVGCK